MALLETVNGCGQGPKANLKGREWNSKTGNPKNIVGIEHGYTYQGPYIPNIFLLCSLGSLFGVSVIAPFIK